eukprot:TRINITY_DN6965_c0_g1_i1.p1 TRINITY_DN6965_c0_g1~~TRINITY_DN6965_c0_g1_i1.p1  ORF type:complete len:280 (+),score=79.36 TRINITY_DN6965_c0_g1_i1:31-870(+)
MVSKAVQSIFTFAGGALLAASYFDKGKDHDFARDALLDDIVTRESVGDAADDGVGPSEISLSDLHLVAITGITVAATWSMLSSAQRSSIRQFLANIISPNNEDEKRTRNLRLKRLMKRRKKHKRDAGDANSALTIVPTNGHEEDSKEEMDCTKPSSSYFRQGYDSDDDEEDYEDDDDELVKKKPELCIVCWDNVADHIIEGCFHLCVCGECAPRVEKLGRCPVCNRQFASPRQRRAQQHQQQQQQHRNNIRNMNHPPPLADPPQRRFIHRVYASGTVLG